MESREKAGNYRRVAMEYRALIPPIGEMLGPFFIAPSPQKVTQTLRLCPCKRGHNAYAAYQLFAGAPRYARRRSRALGQHQTNAKTILSHLASLKTKQLSFLGGPGAEPLVGEKGRGVSGGLGERIETLPGPLTKNLTYKIYTFINELHVAPNTFD